MADDYTEQEYHDYVTDFAGAVSLSLQRQSHEAIKKWYPHLPPRRASDRVQLDIRRLLTVFFRSYRSAAAELQSYWNGLMPWFNKTTSFQQWYEANVYMSIPYTRSKRQAYREDVMQERLPPGAHHPATQFKDPFKPFDAALWLIDALHDAGLVVEERDECPIVYGDISGTKPPYGFTWQAVEDVADVIIESPEEEHVYWVRACALLLALEHMTAAMNELLGKLDELLSSSYQVGSFWSKRRLDELVDLPPAFKIAGADRAVSSRPMFLADTSGRGFV